MHTSNGLEHLAHDPESLRVAAALNSVSGDARHGEVERLCWLDTCASETSRAALDQARCFSDIPEPVMVVGDCGTGKSVFARQIHQWGHGDLSNMQVVSCGTWEALSGQRAGPAVLSLSQFLGTQFDAESGIWLFENVDEVPLKMQGSFLQAVDHILQRKDQSAGPALVSTAASSILTALNSGTFRKDLYYRLSVLQLDLPPLRERCGDLEKLIAYFRDCHPGREQGCQFTADAIEQMADYDWPGNLVELRNVVTRIDALSRQAMVDIDELKRHWQRPRKELDISGMSLEDAETQLIMEALERFRGNKTAAANQLGITTRTLHNKVRKFRSLGLM